MSTVACGLEGRYRFTITHPTLGVRQEVECQNLILNNGLNLLVRDAAYPLETIRLGTGTTAPSVTDSALTATGPSASLQGSGAQGVDVAGGYAWVRVRRRFEQGQATGTWTEVGIGPAAGGLLSKALITDGSGNPTSITVLAIEVLDVDYELRYYWPTTDLTGSIVIAGTNHGYTLRTSAVSSWVASAMTSAGKFTAVGMAAYSGSIAPITSTPSGSLDGSAQSNQASPYAENSYFRDVVYNFAVGGGNLSGGIGSIRLGFGTGSFGDIACHFQIGFTPSIPKDNTKTFSISMRYSYARRP